MGRQRSFVDLFIVYEQSKYVIQAPAFLEFTFPAEGDEQCRNRMVGSARGHTKRGPSQRWCRGRNLQLVGRKASLRGRHWSRDRRREGSMQAPAATTAGRGNDKSALRGEGCSMLKRLLEGQ